MPAHQLIRPLRDFHGRYAREFCARWWIRTDDLAREAGVTQKDLMLWMKGRLPSSAFAGRGAVYDALLTLLVRQAGWADREAVRLRAEQDARMKGSR